MKASEIVKVQNELKQKRIKELEKASARQREIDNGTLIPDNPVTLKEVEQKIKSTSEKSDANYITYDGKLKQSVIKNLKKNGFIVELITDKRRKHVMTDRTRDCSYHVRTGFFKWEKIKRLEPVYETRDLYSTYTMIHWGDEIPTLLSVQHETVVTL